MGNQAPCRKRAAANSNGHAEEDDEEDERRPAKRRRIESTPPSLPPPAAELTPAIAQSSSLSSSSDVELCREIAMRPEAARDRLRKHGSNDHFRAVWRKAMNERRKQLRTDLVSAIPPINSALLGLIMQYADDRETYYWSAPRTTFQKDFDSGTVTGQLVCLVGFNTRAELDKDIRWWMDRQIREVGFARPSRHLSGRSPRTWLDAEYPPLIHSHSLALSTRLFLHVPPWTDSLGIISAA
jgi:hypothetical protein